jgi:16S rRNA (guanine527-N7)-methyltransferase
MPDALMDEVPRETAERLEQFAALLQKWTKSINLVSQGDRDLVWSRHILDSLRFIPLIPAGVPRGLDLGSGAGFPGLVVALVSGIPFDLVEADRRKAAFLIEAQRVTGAPVQVHCTRIEELSLPRVPLITARALAPLAVLLAHAHRLLAHGGTALFAKGARVEDEIANAEKRWRMRVRRFDHPDDSNSTILAVTDVAHA